MSEYYGIELIDQVEREKQHILTKDLWERLCESGIKTGYKGRISCFLFSESFENAIKLKSKYQNDWESCIYEQEKNSSYMIEIITPLCRLSIEAFLELADILMYAAYETSSRFDGFEVNIEEVKNLNKKWWKFR